MTTWQEDLERRARAAAAMERRQSAVMDLAGRDTLGGIPQPKLTPIEQPRSWESRRRQAIRDRCLNIGCWLLGACCLAGFVWIVTQ